ncbi:hypothetical protein TNCT_532231, partial [Trichonephila clavata]
MPEESTTWISPDTILLDIGAQLEAKFIGENSTIQN